MMQDICETLGRSVIHHGPCSNRIYLMKLDRRDLPEIIEQMDDLAHRQGYSKLFAKVSADLSLIFIEHGYQQEAAIPGFYEGTQDALFLGKYLAADRAQVEDPDTLKSVLSLAQDKATNAQEGGAPKASVLPFGLELIACNSNHVDEMSGLYQEVFPSYPFPIHDPDYLRETMNTHIDYFGIVKDGHLIALSSAEMDHAGANVEMTDFATLPKYRGQGLARCLLQTMEAAMVKQKMSTAYTIARAISPGMNITFAQMDYHFCGTLINNTQISGSIESMNVWSKSLSQGNRERKNR